jgi:hypothetical protein
MGKRAAWTGPATVLLGLFIFVGLGASYHALSQLLPTSLTLAGRTLASRPYFYAPQDLYEYIDGAADLFIAYGFVALAGANYGSGGNSSDSFTVDIYDMGEKLNAFGVFQINRDPESSSRGIGTASYGDDNYVVFHKDRYYVEVRAFEESETLKGGPLTIARQVADRIPGDASLPFELSYFPEKARIHGSEKYIRGGILGHAFLDRGLMCEYGIRDDRVSLFLALLPSRQDAVGSFQQYKSFLEEAGQTCLPLEGVGERGFVSREPYHDNLVVIQSGSYILGAFDLPFPNEGIELARQLLKRIPPPN